MITIFNIVTAVCAAIFAVIRLTECINELKKKPELDNAGKVWQILVNFFTIEKYDKAPTLFEEPK